MKTEIWKEKPQTNLDTDFAVNYEQYFVPVIGRPLAEDLIRKAKIKPGERVLDVACGTGIIARLASQEVGSEGSVTGIDLNAGMLRVARSIDLGGRQVQWIESNANNLPLPDNAYNVALCQASLQFFEEKQRALQEIHRVLIPGGRFVMNLPAPSDLLIVLDKAIGKRIDPQSAGLVAMVYSMNDPEDVRTLLDQSGFHRIQLEEKRKTLHLPAPRDFLWQYIYGTPLANLFTEIDDETKNVFEEEVVRGWEKLVVDQGIVYEQPLIEVISRK